VLYDGGMKRIPQDVILSVMFLLATGGALGWTAAEAPPSADDVLSQAEAQAAAERKDIFLIFGASWCGWCKRLDRFNQLQVSAPSCRRDL